jgi:rhodanese-related sulfurtransferase
MNPTADLLDPLELAAMPIRQSDPAARLLLVDVRSARLHSQGYPRRIRALRGGLEAWAARGLPLESSRRRAPAAFRPWLTARA